MLGTFGLKTYIWNNRLKSLILLAGFPVLLLLICLGFALVIASLNDPNIGEGIDQAIATLPALIPIAIVVSLVWFVIAYFANQGIIDAVTGARKVTRIEEPRVWNILENLCISRGITVPQLRIIDSDARNAFASGIRKGRYSVTVTRGLIDALDDAELEAVLAHELTHIENRDVQLLVVAAVFVGIISLVGDLIIRGPRLLLYSSGRSSGGGWSSGGISRGGRSSSKGKGGGGALIIILIAIAIFLIARFLAIMLRFAISRKREFLADAGAVELTKNPDAMISALRKIEGHSELHAPAQVQEMFLDHPTGHGLAALFATHPSIDSRIARLVEYGGGRDQPPAAALVPPAGAAATGTPPAASGSAFGHRDTPPSVPPGGTPPHGPWG